MWMNKKENNDLEKERMLIKRAGGVGISAAVSPQPSRREMTVRKETNNIVVHSSSSDNDEGAMSSTTRRVTASRRQKLDRSLSENSLLVVDSVGSKSKQYLHDRGTKSEETESCVGSTSGLTTGDQLTLSMEQRLKKCLRNLKITNAVWSSDRERHCYQISFCVSAGDICEEVLKVLSESKIGLELDSIVSVLPCSLYYEAKGKSPTPKSENIHVDFSQSQQRMYTQKEQTAWELFMNSVRARMTVAQLVSAVKANAVITFDFLILLIVASLTACVGLVENNTVILVASMLMSPLMGPIMAGTIGFAISDRKLQTIGILNETIGLLLCILIGFLFGLVVGMLGRSWETGKWPTEEMTSRGEVNALWVGGLIALLSGVAVAIAVLGDNTGSLIGVAISASLMPPAVNAGLLWSLVVFNIVTGNTEGTNHKLNVDLTIQGGVSMCLTFVNIICIFVTGIVVLKIKEVSPRVSNDYLRNFWKETIKIARDYNTLSNEEGLISPDRKVPDELGNQDMGVSDIRIPCGPVFPYSADIAGISHTWSPNLITYASYPTAQELASVLHHVTLRPQDSLWAARHSGHYFGHRQRTRPTSSLRHLWGSVTPPSLGTASFSESPGHFSPILERNDSSRQSLSSHTLSRRFTVTPAVSDTD